VLNFGLLLNLVGVVLLFVFGTPFRIAIGGKTTWTLWNIDVQVKHLDDLSGIVGWMGLFMLVFGTLLQMLASTRRPW
jgi:hypothetical protein